MSCTELTFRIIELIIAALIPALIAYFGFRLMRRAEDIKNESASKHLWRTKWTDVLFQKHLTYCDNIVEFLDIWSRLLLMLERGRSDSPESLSLQEENNVVVKRLSRTSIDLKLHSINTIGQNNEIEKLLDDIWARISHMTNKKLMNEFANPSVIFNKLSELNHVTENLIRKKICHSERAEGEEESTE